MKEFNELVQKLEKQEGIASIFGVLIYTDSHPNVKKVLRDDDYWLAFDEITGKRFGVISVKPKIGRYGFPTPPPGMDCFMVPIWKEPKDNKKLLKAFEIENTEDLPILLLFTNSGEEVLKITIQLDDGNISAAYASIKNNLQFCTEALAQVEKENLKSPDGLFSALSFHTDHRVKMEKIKKIVNLYSFLNGLNP